MAAIRLVALTAAVAAAWLGASAPVDAQTPRRGGVLSYVIIGDPATLDCHQSQSVYVLSSVGPVYSGLIKYDQQNYPTIIGDLAESWSISPDGLTYTFKLRPNVKFHDGSPFSAEDIKATFDRIRNPPTGVVSLRKTDFADVSSVDVIDPLTVAFKLSQRNVMLLDIIAMPFNCVMSGKKLAADPLYPTTTPMGTGGFTFDTWVRGERIEGKRFAQYFREGRPYLDGYKVLSVAPPSYGTTFFGGQVDAALASVQPVEAENARAQLGDKVKFPFSIAGTTVFFSINHQRKPFDDLRVRRALNLAIDRRSGIEAMKKITNFIAYGGLNRPGSEFAFSETELQRFPGFATDVAASRAEAKRLLAEAGQSNLKFKILNRPEANTTALGVFVINEWRQIGLDVEQENLSPPIYLERLGKGDFDLAYEGEGGPIADPGALLIKWVPGASANFAKVDDAQLVDLFAKQKQALDKTERKQLINGFEQRMLADAHVIPVFWAGLTMGLRSYVQGWTTTPNFWLGYDLVNIWKSE